jgi:hypothetical protein
MKEQFDSIKFLGSWSGLTRSAYFPFQVWTPFARRSFGTDGLSEVFFKNHFLIEQVKTGQWMESLPHKGLTFQLQEATLSRNSPKKTFFFRSVFFLQYITLLRVKNNNFRKSGPALMFDLLDLWPLPQPLEDFSNSPEKKRYNVQANHKKWVAFLWGITRASHYHLGARDVSQTSRTEEWSRIVSLLHTN